LNGPISTILRGLQFVENRRVLQVVLLHPALDQRDGECRAVNRHVQFGEEVRDGADVVLVPVRQDERTDVFPVLHQEGEIGHDDVHAEEFGAGEHHSRVDDEDVVAVAQGGHVHPELSETAQRNHL
jgi:hypothetical protein